MRRFSLPLLLFCSLIGFSLGESRADFYGNIPTGLLALEKKHPYYLYVPPAYTPDRAWPLIFLLADRGDDPKKMIDLWTDWAKDHDLMVLGIPNLVPEREVPTQANEWLLGVKREVGERYRLDPNRIWLVGFGAGAHYAAYVSLEYPEQFSGAALVGGAWPGPLEQLMNPVSEKGKQVSFFLAFDPQAETFKAVEARALAFEKQGYRIKSVPFAANQSFIDYRDQMFQWFQEDSDSRLKEGAPPKSRKEKFKEFVHQLFEV